MSSRHIDRLFRGRRVAALLAALAILVGVAGITATGAAQTAPRPPKPTVVLVHGSFADASSWSAVIERLQSDGYTALAVANPLRGADTDAAYVRSVLDTIDGPIVLVGHSYGGFVMTNAAKGHPGVEALVYVAGFAPAAGETVGDLVTMNPGSAVADPANLIVRPHPGGVEAYIDPAVFHAVFAADLPRKLTAVLAATQRPGDFATLTQPSGDPAWEDVPSWYVVAREDKVIPPATQRFMAARAGATTIELKSSHVAMISRPGPVTNVIERAALATVATP